MLVLLAAGALTLSSPAIPNGGMIPARYTCDGKGVSPPLRWSAPPTGTRRLVLLVVDPDVPSGRFIHWSATLPPSVRGLREGQHAKIERLNDRGTRGWAGPCPPPGQSHEYLFVLKAYDAHGKAIAEGDLIAHYRRP